MRSRGFFNLARFSLPSDVLRGLLAFARLRSLSKDARAVHKFGDARTAPTRRGIRASGLKVTAVGADPFWQLLCRQEKLCSLVARALRSLAVPWAI